MIRYLVPLIALGLFVALAAHAWHKHPPQHRVTMSQGEFVAQKVAEYTPKDAGVAYQAGRPLVEYPFACEDTDKKCLTVQAEVVTIKKPKFNIRYDTDAVRRLK